MPFIDSKVSIRITPEQETELKTRFGEAISILPGKSETWLMTGFQDEYHLYFRGDNSKPTAFVEVSIYGSRDEAAFDRLTAKITEIFGDVLNIEADRIYVKYNATPDWGWSGRNF